MFILRFDLGLYSSLLEWCMKCFACMVYNDSQQHIIIRSIWANFCFMLLASTLACCADREIWIHSDTARYSFCCIAFTNRHYYQTQNIWYISVVFFSLPTNGHFIIGLFFTIQMHYGIYVRFPIKRLKSFEIESKYELFSISLIFQTVLFIILMTVRPKIAIENAINVTMWLYNLPFAKWFPIIAQLFYLK